uniref:Uncharacterized protein n=1 Tax=Arundo donax TaxID=35708 RepID=A0A0A9EHD8_ARUDO
MFDHKFFKNVHMNESKYTSLLNFFRE